MSLTVNWKLAVGIGAAAFLLSVFSGVVGGVGFGAVIVRALLAGLVFAAVGVGLELVVRRFLPELIDADTSSDLGSRVNIVVDDEEDQLPAGAEKPSVDGASDPGDEATGARSGEESDPEDNWDDLENPEESLVQEVQEARGGEESVETSNTESGVAEETAPSTESGESSSTEQPSSVGTDELDELPDVGRFAEDFTSDGTPQSPQDSGPSNSGSVESNGQDPAMIARALQTMLKRESE